MSSDQTRSPKDSLFPETRWSLVVRAQGNDNTLARRALGELCQNYWYPIYGFARSRGLAPPDAEDATQSFFQNLLGRNSIESVSATHGRLRAFLLASMKHFLASRLREKMAQKRGGNSVHIPIDRAWAENNLSTESLEASSDTALFFDRHWAYTLLKTVSTRLEDHYDRVGKREVYEAIKGCLEGDGSYDPGEELSQSLGISPEGVRSAVFKLRRRFRDYLQQEVAETCADEEEARGEILHLCKILAQ